MKIDRALNLILPIERDSATAYLHSTPISRPVFEVNYRLIARAHSELFGRGTAYAIGSGPRIAALALKDAGRQNAAERGNDGDGGATELLAEIRRLTSVLVPSDAGWETLPVDAALKRGGLDAEEWAEAEHAIAFFMLVSAMTRRAALPKVLEAMASVLGVRIVSQSPTEFGASLPTSTPAAPSLTRAGSSVPF